MPMTINSGANSYCTPVQFTTLFDFRGFAQLASDNDTPLSQEDPGPLQASPILAACLQLGAGDIEMACTVSARYDPTDLAALVSSDPITNSGWSLIAMNAALAAGRMYDRRFEAAPDDIAKKVDDAQAKLAALEEGIAIFGFSETQQAGLTQEYRETPGDVARRNLPSFIARRVLGRRANMRWGPGWPGCW